MSTTAVSFRHSAGRHYTRTGLLALLLILPWQPSSPGLEAPSRPCAVTPDTAAGNRRPIPANLPPKSRNGASPACTSASPKDGPQRARFEPKLLLTGLTLCALLLSAGLALHCLRLNQRLRLQNRRLKLTEQALQAGKAEQAQRIDRDPLTGLHNPATFQKQALQQIRRAERYGHPLSLVLLDIDAFKTINDSHGLRVGDGVLCSLARLLARNLRESDQLCRWGGEAFLMLVPHSDPRQAVQLANRLRGLLARNPLLVDRAITASFGVASLQPGEALGELLGLARQALQRAKAAGRNCIACAEPEG